MQADGRIGVAVLTHDRREDVTRTLDRLVALPEVSRIVVVDNASSDGTAEAIARRFPQVDVVRLERNAGAAGRNAGVRHLDDVRYVALCDDDTWWAPGALCRAADVLDAYPRLAIVNGRVLVGRDEHEDPTCAEMARSPLDGHAGPGPALLGFMASASVVRRAAFLAAGGFDARFFLGGEERLLAVDLAAAGWTLVYCADVVVHHHPSPHRDTAKRRRLLTRNGLWFAWLRRPAGRALRYTARTAALAARDPIARRGALDALRGLPWVLAERRVVSRPIEAGLRRLERDEAQRATVRRARPAHAR